jgi:hypothetical protein
MHSAKRNLRARETKNCVKMMVLSEMVHASGDNVQVYKGHILKIMVHFQ